MLENSPYIELLKTSKMDEKSIKKLIISNILAFIIVLIIILCQYFKYDEYYFGCLNDGETICDDP